MTFSHPATHLQWGLAFILSCKCGSRTAFNPLSFRYRCRWCSDSADPTEIYNAYQRFRHQ